MSRDELFGQCPRCGYTIHVGRKCWMDENTVNMTDEQREQMEAALCTAKADCPTAQPAEAKK